MSYRENAAIISTACLADGVYEMWLKTEKIAKESRPGQFISVYSNDGSRLLPRPISICRIDDDKLKKLFQIGDSFSTDGTEKEKGTGLGLIICKEFIEYNNGSIYVESKINEGSVFTIKLPKE